MKFHVPDMSCDHCTAAIEKGLKAADPLATVTPDLSSRMVDITSSLDAATVQSLLDKAGSPSRPA